MLSGLSDGCHRSSPIFEPQVPISQSLYFFSHILGNTPTSNGTDRDTLPRCCFARSMPVEETLFSCSLEKNRHLFPQRLEVYKQRLPKAYGCSRRSSFCFMSQAVEPEMVTEAQAKIHAV